MFSLFGAAGQALYNRADARHSQSVGVPESKKGSWLNSKWSPVKVLSDDEYEHMLRERLLKINAQIALVDESIEEIRKEEAREEVSEALDASTTK
jgi:hypothetical protein